MKWYIKLQIILFALIFAFPGFMVAQVNSTQGMIKQVKDSIAANKGENVPIAGPSDRLVQIAFRKVKRKNIVGDISVVNMPQIIKKNYITNSLNYMQAHVGGFNGEIRGMGNYLVYVDGVPRNASSVVPASIKQITFLKGVSAVALYGSHAVNGVILITTKKGGNHKLRINGRVDAGMFVPKAYPSYLGSAKYMQLYNLARKNDGLSPLYSKTKIYHYATGQNPFRYPSVNYYSKRYLNSFYNRYDANFGISGGGDHARYYTNINFSKTGSLLNFGNAKSAGRAHLSIRGKVNLDIGKYITGTIEGATVYDNQKGINVNYWQEAATLRPNSFTPLIPVRFFKEGKTNLMQTLKNSTHVIDGRYLLGGTQLYTTNPIADVYAAGTNQNINRLFQFNVGLNANLVKLLKGLSFHSTLGVDYRSGYTEAFNNQYAVYEPAWVNYNGNNMISGLTKYDLDSKSGVQNISSSSFLQTISFSGGFHYHHTANGIHHISAMLIANGYQQTQTGVYQPTNNINLGILLGYNYRDKYYINFVAAAPYSSKLPKGNRIGFSPTVSLAWRLSKENFMSNVSAINNLKLFVSAGILDTDTGIPGYYLYEANFSRANPQQYFSWRDGALRIATESRRGANPDLTYIKRKEINAGIDMSFFNNILVLNGTFFYDRRSGEVVQSGVFYPSYFQSNYPKSSFIPYINYNIDGRSGIDFNININKNIGGVALSFGIAGTYFNTTAVKHAEVHQFAYQNRQGRPVDGIWGLQSKGLFMNKQEIASSPEQTFGTVQPGDIEYKDQNGDGVIDQQDVVFLGKSGADGAPFTYGLHLTLRWRNFTLFALGTGKDGAYGLKNSSYYWISGDDKYSAVVLNSWTEQTKKTATYPRLTTLAGANNYRVSSFWMYSTDRFNLREVQLTYNFSKKLLGNGYLTGLQVYIRGSNLLTISPHRDIMKLNIGGAPQTRFYNIGIKASF